MSIKYKLEEKDQKIFTNLMHRFFNWKYSFYYNLIKHEIKWVREPADFLANFLELLDIMDWFMSFIMKIKSKNVVENSALVFPISLMGDMAIKIYNFMLEMLKRYKDNIAYQVGGLPDINERLELITNFANLSDLPQDIFPYMKLELTLYQICDVLLSDFIEITTSFTEGRRDKIYYKKGETIFVMENLEEYLINIYNNINDLIKDLYNDVMYYNKGLTPPVSRRANNEETCS
jgi:hypothetical protein